MKNLSQELIENLIQFCYDEISIFDENGFVIFDNGRNNDVYGREVVGLHISQMKEITDLSVAKIVFKTKKTVHAIQSVLNKKKIFVVTAVPILKNDKIKYIITSSRDISLFNKVNFPSDKCISQSYTPETNEDSTSLSENNGFVWNDNASDFVSQIKNFAKLNAKILITGESGTGKTLLAKIIHDLSMRSSAHLVSINCAAIPSELLEAELFGYDPGAFTGASKSGKLGLFELASGGTLFLDEIAELPLPLQAKLLGVLQTETIRRVGGIKDIPIDIRLICATNCDIEECVAQKKFRKDLYYRINVLRIELPPLRKRKNDLIMLIKNLIKGKNKKYKKNYTITDDCFETLQKYPWPGNIRELENVIEYLFAVSKNSLITISDLPSNILNYADSNSYSDSHLSYDEQINSVKRKIISASFQKYKSSYKVAKDLGISQTRAYNLIKSFGLF